MFFKQSKTNEKIILCNQRILDDVNRWTRNEPWNCKYFDVGNFFGGITWSWGSKTVKLHEMQKTQWELNLKTIKLKLLNEILLSFYSLVCWEKNRLLFLLFTTPNPSSHCCLVWILTFLLKIFCGLCFGIIFKGSVSFCKLF